MNGIALTYLNGGLIDGGKKRIAVTFAGVPMRHARGRWDDWSVGGRPPRGRGRRRDTNGWILSDCASVSSRPNRAIRPPPGSGQRDDPLLSETTAANSLCGTGF